jgi:phosphate-selective porin
MAAAAVLMLGTPALCSAQILSGPSPIPGASSGPSEDDGLKALRFVWREHPSLRAGRNFRVDFQMKLQEDARRAGDDPADFNTFELHRARVGIDGEVFRRIQFSVERELTENETGVTVLGVHRSAWKDYYIDVNIADALQVRGGRFKIPFGLEQLTGISNLDFVYRSLSGSTLAPARDRGVMLHGRFFDRGLNYWAGWFEHDGDNSRANKIAGGDGTFAARLTGTPFRKIRLLRSIEVGGAYTSTDVSDDSFLPNGLRGRTVMSQHTFYEQVFVKGHRTRIEGDIDWNKGPFTTRGEYTWVGDDRDNQGFGNDNLPQARARAWYASGAWIITGEKKDRPVEPRKGGIPRGGPGAVELAARYERMRFGSVVGVDEPFRNPRADTILAVADRVATFGVNWFINRWVKLQGNLIREQVDDPERSPMPGGAAWWSQIVRLQIVL